MLNRLIRWSIDNRFMVLCLAAIFVTAGIYLGMHMDVDVLPDFAPPKVEIQTEAPGMVAQEVESVVSMPLEAAINGTPGVTWVKSISMAGISKLSIVFQDGTNIYTDRQLVAEKIQMVRGSLPQSCGMPTMEPVSSELGDIVKVGFLSDHLSLLELRGLCDWDIRNRLLAVPGVARVVIFGGDQKQFQVLIDPQKLRASAVTLDQLANAVGACNAVSPNGFLVTADTQTPIHGALRVRSAQDIREAVVTQHNGIPIRVKHVAQVIEGGAFPVGDAVVNGKRGIEIIITKQPGVGTLDVTRRVQQTLSQIASEHKEIQLVPIFQQSDFIQQAISNMASSIWLGGAIVVVVLLLFLFNWRTSVISLTAIPLSLLCAVAVIKGLGGSINTMTLGGLAIAVGEVVDDAVVDVENAYRRLRENRAQGSPESAFDVIFKSCTEVRSSVVYATFVVALVFLPVFTLGGVEGRLFGQLGLSYVAATVSSLGVALIVTPALCAYFLARDGAIPAHEPRLLEALKSAYSSLLQFVIAYPAQIMAATTVVLILSASLVPFMGHAFLPDFEEKDLMIPTSAMAGQSLQASTRIGLAVEEALSKLDDVAAVGQRVGRAELDDDAAAPNFSEFDVRLKNGAKLDEATDKIRTVLNGIPGITFEVASFLTDHINDVLSGGTQADLVIKIFGPDIVVLRKTANDMATILKTVPGMADVTPEQQILIPELDIAIDRQKASRYGVTAADVAGALEKVVQGPIVSQVLEDQRLYGLRIWGQADTHDSPADIAAIPLDTTGGVRIPLSEVASVRVGRGPNALVRENVNRRVTVLANITAKDMVGVVDKAQDKIQKQLNLPPGYYITYAGQYAAQKSSTQRLAVVSFIAFCGILLLLAQGLGSVRAALLVASNLPLAAIGGIFAVALTGNVLSLGSLIGFISLFGISTRNSLLLVSHINQLIREGTHLKRAIYQGAVDRLAPVLMTALTAALGMLPLAIQGGSGRELEQPLAAVIVGGLITSTALTLLVIPALYCLFGQRVIAIQTSES